MKHIISFVLALCLLVPFGTGALAADADWTVDYYVDDFGDPTDDAYLRGEASGDFSNTATPSSPLTVVIFYDWDYNVFSFRLLENGYLPVTYTDVEAEDAVFMIKTADGAISEGTLIGDEPNGDLYLDYDLPVVARMMDALLGEEEVRCIVELGVAKYNFTVDGAGFPGCLAGMDETKCALVYAKAEELLASGDKLGAAKVFGAIKNYSDAWERSFDLWGEITSRAAVDGGATHTVGLRADGTVVATKYTGEFDLELFLAPSNVSDWSDVVAVSAGSHTVGLYSDGTVAVAADDNSSSWCDVSDWTDIVAVAAGDYHTIGLRSDGTVVAVGSNILGECDVEDWTDIVTVSASFFNTAGLRSDGTVVVAGGYDDSQSDVSGWKDIVAVSVGHDHTVGLRSDGTVVAAGENSHGECDVSEWKDIVAVSAGDDCTFGLKSDGTVVAVGDNGDGQCNVGDWSDIVAISTGWSYTVGLRSDGTVVAVGDNSCGQCDVSNWTDIKLPDATKSLTNPEKHV